MKLWALLLICTIVTGYPQGPVPVKLGVVLNGPGSSVIIEGPDGSRIKADASGGVVSVGDSEAPKLLPPSGTLEITEASKPTEDSNAAEASKAPEAAKTTEPWETPETPEAPETPEPSESSPPNSETDETAEVTPSSNVVPSDPEVAKSPPDVEILDPVTLAPSAPGDEDVELDGPSGRILVNSGGVVVAGPASTLVKNTGPRVDRPEKLIAGFYGLHPAWPNVAPLSFPLIFNVPQIVRSVR